MHGQNHIKFEQYSLSINYNTLRSASSKQNTDNNGTCVWNIVKQNRGACHIQSDGQDYLADSSYG